MKMWSPLFKSIKTRHDSNSRLLSQTETLLSTEAYVTEQGTNTEIDKGRRTTRYSWRRGNQIILSPVSPGKGLAFILSVMIIENFRQEVMSLIYN